MPFCWVEPHQAAFEALKRALCEAPVLQVPNFDKAFVLATDASDVAVSAVLHQDVNGVLTPIAYHSLVLTAAERKYSTYEKECLAVLFGCEKCRPYLEHKEFLLHCDNLALCWLLRKTKDDTQLTCAMLLQSLPLVYSSLTEHQAKDDYCAGINDRLQAKLPGSENFQRQKGLLCYYPKQAKRCRWVVPVSLTEMLLKYFHDSVFSGHLGARKTYKIASNFWWRKMRLEIFGYVRRCELCQRAKPAQDSGVGLHSASPATAPMERLFIDFVGRLTRTKRGSMGILVIVDSF